MKINMTDKTILVTGAGTGIGQSIAKEFAEAGAKVLIVGRTAKTLEETAALHTNIDYLVADLNKSTDIANIAATIKTKYKTLDVLVNNAGWAPVTPLGNINVQEYELAFNTNTRTVFELTQALLPLIKEVQGKIINISSTAASQPLANMSVYSGCKAAVNAFTRAWANELAPAGIRVNSVSPGPIETPIYDKTDLTPDELKAHRARVTSMVPLARFGLPEEVSPLVLFLASNYAAFITGVDIPVDGGMIA